MGVGQTAEKTGTKTVVEIDIPGASRKAGPGTTRSERSDEFDKRTGVGGSAHGPLRISIRQKQKRIRSWRILPGSGLFSIVGSAEGALQGKSMEMENEGNGRTKANLGISSLSSLRGAQALLTKFIGEAFHIGFALNSNRLSSSAGATQQSIPFRVRCHIAPERVC